MPDNDPNVIEPRAMSDRRDIAFASSFFDPLRDAVSALIAAGERVTLASEVRAAISDRVRRLEQERNAGHPFPRRKSNLPSGRPRGAKKER